MQLCGGSCFAVVGDFASFILHAHAHAHTHAITYAHALAMSICHRAALCFVWGRSLIGWQAKVGKWCFIEDSILGEEVPIDAN